jgi:hypothetical protein
MRVLYVEGDVGSPRYFAGALRLAGHAVDRVVRADPTPWWHAHDVVVVSGTPAGGLGALEADLVEAVREGRGLLVAAGGRSLSEGFAGSRLAEILPVDLVSGDVVNAPVFARLTGEHPAIEGLPRELPVLTGYARVTPREHGTVLAEGREVASVGEEGPRYSHDRAPLLVVGAHARGRVAVLATSLASRWSGGLTDWGTTQMPVDDHDAVGDAYARFVDGLVRWLGAGDRSGLTRRRGVGTEAVLGA